MGDMVEAEASAVGTWNRSIDSVRRVRRGLPEEGRVPFAVQKRDKDLHVQSTGG